MKDKKIAQAGPGYRPRPGSDAAGNRERRGTDLKWDQHMQMWVPTRRASNTKRTKKA